jgi:CheY-like chemotaxis protein
MAANQEAEKQARQALRLLVVDDNQDAADSLSTLLKLKGHDVRVAYDGVAGFEAARTHRPHCMLLDIAMPRLNGYELARRVRQLPELERTRLVALTAYADETHRRRAREAGFDHHLVKPADLDEIERILNMLHEVVRLANRTEELARQNAALAREAKALLQEVKEDIREVKEEMKELKEELCECKDESREGPRRSAPTRQAVQARGGRRG